MSPFEVPVRLLAAGRATIEAAPWFGIGKAT